MGAIGSILGGGGAEGGGGILGMLTKPLEKLKGGDMKPPNPMELLSGIMNLVKGGGEG